jgi:RNA polymerase sigma factor (sigma-70 family)
VQTDRVRSEDQDLYRLYLEEIGRYPLLTQTDERLLARTISEGEEAREELERRPEMSSDEQHRYWRLVRLGDDARTMFVQSNLRLVVALAKKYQWSGMPILDLIQEGNFGLMHAVEKFDWRKGFKFSTYATWWIRQSIMRGVENQRRTIRIPAHIHDALFRTRTARQTLEARLGRTPTIPELAEETGIPEAKLRRVLMTEIEPLSLSEPVGEDGSVVADVVEDESAASPFDSAVVASMPDAVKKLLSSLDKRERAIVTLRYGLDGGEPRTLEEVASVFGLTRERVRQLEHRAMARLRDGMYAESARELLNA